MRGPPLLPSPQAAMATLHLSAVRSWDEVMWELTATHLYSSGICQSNWTSGAFETCYLKGVALLSAYALLSNASLNLIFRIVYNNPHMLYSHWRGILLNGAHDGRRWYVMPNVSFSLQQPVQNTCPKYFSALVWLGVVVVFSFLVY